MKSWKTRLLVVFTMVTMMLAGSATATAQPFVWVPCIDWWQDPITGEWWCLTPSGWVFTPVAAAQAPVEPVALEERVVREFDEDEFLEELIDELREEDDEDDEDDDDDDDDNNDDNDVDFL